MLLISSHPVTVSHVLNKRRHNLNKTFISLFQQQNRVCVCVWSRSADWWLIIKYQSVHLDKLCPLCHRPHPVRLHIAWWWFPVPDPQWDVPGGAIVCCHVVKRLTWNTHFQLKKLRPAQREAWKDVPGDKKKKIFNLRQGWQSDLTDGNDFT